MLILPAQAGVKDNQTNTLTLDGFNYEGNGSGIETPKDLNIITKNENRIKNISSSYSDSTKWMELEYMLLEI